MNETYVAPGLTQAQLDHLNENLTAFQLHTGSVSVEGYFADHWDNVEKPDLYERVCDDLGLTPVLASDVSDARRQSYDQQEKEKVDAMEWLQQITATTAPLQPPEQVEQVTFEQILDQVDPRDSEAALAMLEWLLRNGRLNRLGTLDGGLGYLFAYKEPKGTTKGGYVPGGTKGGRIVDAALDAHRAAGHKPRKTGMCPHCFNVVFQEEGGPVMMDDPEHIAKGDADVCPGGSSPDGKHELAR